MFAGIKLICFGLDSDSFQPKPLGEKNDNKTL